MRPRLGISIGDPNGIGPEISLKALSACKDVDLVLIGDPDLLCAQANSLGLAPPENILQSDIRFPRAEPGQV
nr:4-hydroxythreonine-4-phosphate dehydrogenase PdxA [Kiritimatiellia bacterium]